MDCFDLVVISADTAFKGLNTSDYVALQVWGKANGKGDTLKGKAYLLDQLRAKIDGPSTVRAIKALKDKWEYVEAVYIEDKASGPIVVSTLKEQGVPGVIAVPVEKGKDVRASAYAIFVEAGDVILPDPKIFGNWVNDFIHEHSIFPNGQNDDMVDAAGQAITKLLARRGGGVVYMSRKEVV
jgi:predicted phage terminase large subunit-like protein